MSTSGPYTHVNIHVHILAQTYVNMHIHKYPYALVRNEKKKEKKTLTRKKHAAHILSIKNKEDEFWKKEYITIQN